MEVREELARNRLELYFARDEYVHCYPVELKGNQRRARGRLPVATVFN